MLRFGNQYIFPRKIAFRERKSVKGLLVLLAFFLLITYSFIWFDKKVRPAVMAMAEARANYVANKVINEVVKERITVDEFRYDRLIILEKGQNGQITALQANLAQMNRLKSDLTLDIQERIAKLDNPTLQIPLGNILHWQLLSGWGPRIPVTIVPVGVTRVDFKSTFVASGINQTKHEIDLDVVCRIGALVPFANSSAEVKTTIPVAQTVLVGTVPQFYLNQDKNDEMNIK